MRFDDSLDTVLAADMSTPFGAQSAWRQMVDLIGRGRAEPTEAAIGRLRAIRADIPAGVRAASARTLEFTDPPAILIHLFAEDDVAIAAPVLRGARLPAPEWIALLPRLSPTIRSLLRHRRDLEPAVYRALENFAAIDFVLPAGARDDRQGVAEGVLDQANPAAPEAPPPLAILDTPFVSLATVARGLPIVAEALRQKETAHAANALADEPPPPPTGHGPFRISDLVARIDAYQRRRDGTAAPDTPSASGEQPPATGFRFETDATGVFRWVSGVARAAIIGLQLDSSPADGSLVDGVAAGAFRRRAPFNDARLLIEGHSDAGGQWRISAIPVFDPLSGRFTGYRGTARRPRADERADLPRHAASNSLRQLVHELRTPTTAIAGFAEMIEAAMLGPLPGIYRDRAGVIHAQARDLLAAIDDLDTAARIESHALDLRPVTIAIVPLLARIADNLAPLASLRETEISLDPAMSNLNITGDDRAVERLLGRLMAALAAAGGKGERIGIKAVIDGKDVAISFDRPAALAAYAGDALLAIDAESEAEAVGAPLLGTGFALRLARNLASELGGSLTIGPERLTLRLAAAVTEGVGQVSSH